MSNTPPPPNCGECENPAVCRVLDECRKPHREAAAVIAERDALRAEVAALREDVKVWRGVASKLMEAARSEGEPTSCPHGVPHRWPCEVCDDARAAGKKT